MDHNRRSPFGMHKSHSTKNFSSSARHNSKQQPSNKHTSSTFPPMVSLQRASTTCLSKEHATTNHTLFPRLDQERPSTSYRGTSSTHHHVSHTTAPPLPTNAVPAPPALRYSYSQPNPQLHCHHYHHHMPDRTPTHQQRQQLKQQQESFRSASTTTAHMPVVAFPEEDERLRLLTKLRRLSNDSSLASSKSSGSSAEQQRSSCSSVASSPWWRRAKLQLQPQQQQQTPPKSKPKQPKGMLRQRSFRFQRSTSVQDLNNHHHRNNDSTNNKTNEAETKTNSPIRFPLRPRLDKKLQSRRDLFAKPAATPPQDVTTTATTMSKKSPATPTNKNSTRWGITASSNSPNRSAFAGVTNDTNHHQGNDAGFSSTNTNRRGDASPRFKTPSKRPSPGCEPPKLLRRPKQQQQQQKTHTSTSAATTNQKLPVLPPRNSEMTTRPAHMLDNRGNESADCPPPQAPISPPRMMRSNSKSWLFGLGGFKRGRGAGGSADHSKGIAQDLAGADDLVEKSTVPMPPSGLRRAQSTPNPVPPPPPTKSSSPSSGPILKRQSSKFWGRFMGGNNSIERKTKWGASNTILRSPDTRSNNDHSDKADMVQREHRLLHKTPPASPISPKHEEEIREMNTSNNSNFVVVPTPYPQVPTVSPQASSSCAVPQQQQQQQQHFTMFVSQLHEGAPKLPERIHGGCDHKKDHNHHDRNHDDSDDEEEELHLSFRPVCHDLKPRPAAQDRWSPSPTIDMMIPKLPTRHYDTDKSNNGGNDNDNDQKPSLLAPSPRRPSSSSFSSHTADGSRVAAGPFPRGLVAHGSSLMIMPYNNFTPRGAASLYDNDTSSTDEETSPKQEEQTAEDVQGGTVMMMVSSSSSSSDEEGEDEEVSVLNRGGYLAGTGAASYPMTKNQPKSILKRATTPSTSSCCSKSPSPTTSVDNNIDGHQAPDSLEADKDGPHTLLLVSATPPRPSVRFDHVEIREYERTVGCNPACLSGPAFSLGWNVLFQTHIPLEDFEHFRASQGRRNRREFHLSPAERERLLSEWQLHRVFRESKYHEFQSVSLSPSVEEQQQKQQQQHNGNGPDCSDTSQPSLRGTTILPIGSNSRGVSDQLVEAFVPTTTTYSSSSSSSNFVHLRGSPTPEKQHHQGLSWMAQQQ